MLLEAQAEDKFKDLYRFTFQFGLDSEEGQRSLHRDIAIALWRLVFTQDMPPILECGLDFLTENPPGGEGHLAGHVEHVPQFHSGDRARPQQLQRGRGLAQPLRHLRGVGGGAQEKVGGGEEVYLVPQHRHCR
uniref:DCN1-like protein n=1 Tax=Anguilla anguilla TaxID=7936 RepID=A0A0E9PFQ1_ANGAN